MASSPAPAAPSPAWHAFVAAEIRCTLYDATLDEGHDPYVVAVSRRDTRFALGGGMEMRWHRWTFDAAVVGRSKAFDGQQRSSAYFSLGLKQSF